MIQLRHILCPVDDSEPSRHALRQAASMARQSTARLTLLHSAQPLQIPAAEVGGSADSVLRHEDEEHIRSWMAGDQRLAASLGVEADTQIVIGPPAKEIVAAATRLAADIIVLGTHGRSGVSHLLLGSVAESVLRHAQCPVLTVPRQAEGTAPIPFARVLCAIDFSDCSLRALEFAMTASIDAGAELVLAHALEWPWPEPPAPSFDDISPEEAEALRRFRERRERDMLRRLTELEPVGLEGRCSVVVTHGHPATELLRLAREHQVDLIVLGIRGRRVLDLAMFGSTAYHVVRRAECAVLTVRC